MLDDLTVDHSTVGVIRLVGPRNSPVAALSAAVDSSYSPLGDFA